MAQAGVVTYNSVEELEQRIHYLSVVNPTVAFTKNMNNQSLWGTIKISAQPFDIRTCNMNDLFVFSDSNVDKRINWGKAILYNYVGVKLEKAQSEGEYNVNSNVGWIDITNSIDFERAIISPTLKEGNSYYCGNYIDIVGAHNMLYSNYLGNAINSQYYNYNIALNYNKYMDVTTGSLSFDVDDIITSIRSNDATAQEDNYNYGTPTSLINNLTISLEYRINHTLTTTPQTYKLTVGNPSNVETPYVVCFYHKGNSQYYTYVDNTQENNENGETLLYYDVNNVTQNKIKINLRSLGNFENVRSVVKLVMKKNVIATQDGRT